MNNLAYVDKGYPASRVQLAQQENSQVLTEWINRLLISQGARASVRVTSKGCLHVFLQLDWIPESRADQSNWRDRLVRCVCHQVSSLNAEWIQGVRITARLAGYPQILWQQSVRISTPANLRLKQPPRKRVHTKRLPYWVNFKFFRFLLLCSLGITSLAFAFRPSNKTAVNPPIAEPLPQASPTAIAPAPLNLVFSAPAQFQGKVVHRIKPVGDEKLIALTFDDGPWKNTTLQVLEILREYDVKATFFLVGRNLKKYPEIARAVVAEGHAIGNHTWSHSYLKMNEPTAAYEVDATNQLIYETTGVQTSLFRPPGGLMNNGVAAYAKKNNFTIMMWSVDSRDYRMSSASKLLDKVVKNPKPGDIVLLHDGGGDRSATVKALPQIITVLKEQGYRFVTIPELFELGDFLQTLPENAPLEGNVSEVSDRKLVLGATAISSLQSE